MEGGAENDAIGCCFLGDGEQAFAQQQPPARQR